MKLRVIHEPWKMENSYTVQEWREPLHDWMWVSSHQGEPEAEAAAVLRLKGPRVIKEYNTEFKDHERSFC